MQRSEGNTINFSGVVKGLKMNHDFNLNESSQSNKSNSKLKSNKSNSESNIHPSLVSQLKLNNTGSLLNSCYRNDEECNPTPDQNNKMNSTKLNIYMDIYTIKTSSSFAQCLNSNIYNDHETFKIPDNMTVQILLVFCLLPNHHNNSLISLVIKELCGGSKERIYLTCLAYLVVN